MRRSRYRARKYWQTHLWKGVTCFLTCQLAEAEAAYYQVMQKACWVLRSWIHILNCSTCAFISNNCSNTNCSFHKNAIFSIKKTNKRIHEGTELCCLVTESGPEGTAWCCVRGGAACQGKAVPRGRWAQPNLPELRECLGTALTHRVWDCVVLLFVPTLRYGGLLGCAFQFRIFWFCDSMKCLQNTKPQWNF